MRNPYAPPGSPVGDREVKSNRLRVFYVCTVTSIVAALGILFATLAAFGLELSSDVVLGLCVVAIPLAVMSGAVIAQFRRIGVYVGAVACSFMTLVATVVLMLLAA